MTRIVDDSNRLPRGDPDGPAQPCGPPGNGAPRARLWGSWAAYFDQFEMGVPVSPTLTSLTTNPTASLRVPILGNSWRHTTAAAAERRRDPHKR